MPASTEPLAPKGAFITLEGPDGVGKTTQCDLLCSRLAEAGREVVRLREPGGTDVGEKVRGVLLDPGNAGMDPVCELLLYEAARAQLVAQVVRPALERGAVVVSDRFFDSTFAYQGFGRGLDLELVERMNDAAVAGTTPDVTLLLELQAAEAHERATRDGADRIELEGDAFRARVAAGFEEAAERHPGRIRRVDACGTPEEVFERVEEALRGLLARQDDAEGGSR